MTRRLTVLFTLVFLCMSLPLVAQKQTQGGKKTQTKRTAKGTSKTKKAAKSATKKTGGVKSAGQSTGKTGTGAGQSTGSGIPKPADKPKPPAPVVEEPFKPGEWFKLFEPTSLKGWKLRHEGGKNQWTMVDGVLSNAGPGTDLVSERTFGSFALHVEINVPPGGNSGVYLQGRYEIQVHDSSAMKDLNSSMMGAIYSKLTPKKNVALPAGEWQNLDVSFFQAVRDETGAILYKPRVTIILNDEMIIDADIDGVTGGCLDNTEGTPGPIMLQGDHTAVKYRNLMMQELPSRKAPKVDDEEPPRPPKQDEKDK